jgi:hypothetical protein
VLLFCGITLKANNPLPEAYPQALSTLGDYLDLGLLQKEVAEKLDR